jgi:glyoxylase-like metal-dependent hydrolase (beta-lactamase superfamily II)
MKVIPITIPFPKEYGGTGKGTNAYVIKDDQTIMIDCGLDSQENRNFIKKALESIGSWKLDAILFTHGHVDHFGLGAYLQNETGAEIMVHESDAIMLEDYKAYISGWFKELYAPAIEGGYNEIDLNEARLRLTMVAEMMRAPKKFTPFKDLNIELKGGSIKTIHLPGHTAGSVGYILGENVFSGDSAIEGTTNVMNLKDELLSLQKLKIFKQIFPGHGRAPLQSVDIETIESYFVARLDDVLRATMKGSTLKEIVGAINPGIIGTSSKPHRLILPINQVLAYLKYLEAEGHIVKQRGKWLSFSDHI